jgi:hypothetical protein
MKKEEVRKRIKAIQDVVPLLGRTAMSIGFDIAISLEARNFNTTMETFRATANVGTEAMDKFELQQRKKYTERRVYLERMQALVMETYDKTRGDFYEQDKEESPGQEPHQDGSATEGDAGGA